MQLRVQREKPQCDRMSCARLLKALADVEELEAGCGW